jgi:uncharacterized membrane protein HdeD (DUF308 family)
MFKSVSTSLMWRGVLAIAIGVVSLVWPDITVGAFVILFAVYAFMTAAADAARAFASRDAGPVVGYLLLSVISVAAGVLALAWPDITAMALTLCVGVWAFMTGVLEVGLAFRRGEPAGERALWILGGLISLVFGAVLVVRPDEGAVTLAIVFGMFSIISGISALVLAAQLRRTHDAAEQLIDAGMPQRAGHRA